jgi:hypothetical protein
MPLDPPVTIATLPLSDSMVFFAFARPTTFAAGCGGPPEL